jgi:hypothetical protein
MLKDNADPLAYASDRPNVGELLLEYQRSINNSTQGDAVSRFDNVRFARWDGQTDDGKKWSDSRPEGSPAWPFEGASDTRNRLIDSSCNELTALLTSAFSRSDLRAVGTELSDLTVSSIGTTLLKWVRDNKLRFELIKEARLLAQYALQYGWSALFIGWEQRVSKRDQPITLQQIAEMGMQSGSQVLSELPVLIQQAQDEAVAIIQALLPISKSEATRMVKELAEKGETTMEEEYISKNLPQVLALKPWDEVVVPPETTDLQRARCVFRRTWMTEVELREKALTDGWNEEWIDKAVEQSGRSNSFWGTYVQPTTNTLSSNITSYRNLIEVVYCYTRSLDGDGSSIFVTVLCPQVAATGVADSEYFGKHERLDYAHGEYPFVEFRREEIRRAIIDSRGIPEIASTDQDEIKAQHDSIRDHTAFSTLPPIKVVKRIGAMNKVGPGVQLPVVNMGDYSFMEPPAREPTTAFNLIKRVEANHAAYFGLLNVDVHPQKIQMMQQMLVDSWLGSWRVAFKQMFALCLQYMAPEEIQRITGVALPQSMSDIHNEFDMNIRFDVKDMDKDHVQQKIELLSQIAQMDVGGDLNRSRLTQMLVQAIAPEMANELIMTQQQASQKLYKDVQNDIGMMMLGNEALYTENDPTAATKLQYAQQSIQANPKAQAALQQDEQFRALFENYVKNLQMSIMQQQNAQIGKLGVNQLQ